ncbi:MAG: hypothetical protein LBF66_00840 [Holosporales bacterium]|jgi:NADH:ubiquinone oxidoreductase subunit 2 (subunit N)|nr:hypothetical protein [Holosporales bacterium]
MPELFLIFIPAAPEMLLMIGAACLFVVPRMAQRAYFYVLFSCVLVLLLQDRNIGLNVIEGKLDPTASSTTFSGMFIVDCFTKIQKLTVCAWTLLYVLITSKFKKFCGDELFGIATIVFGSMLAISANDFMLLFLGYEFISFGTIVFLKSNDKEILINVFTMLGIGTALILFGTSIFYGVFGTTDFSVLSTNMAEKQPFTNVAVVLLLMGLFAKSLYLPAHGLCIEAAEKTDLSAFILVSFVSNLTTFSTMGRIVTLFRSEPVVHALLLFGFFGMALGLLGVIRHSQIKNILACHLIGTVGMLHFGLGALRLSSISSSLTLLAVYGLSLLVFLGGTLLIERQCGKIVTLNDLLRIHNKSPWGMFLLVFGILNLFNVLPTPGFIHFFTFTMNFVDSEAFAPLWIVLTLKTISMAAGLKFVQALVIRSGDAPHANATPFPTLAVVISLALVVWAVYSDSISNVFMLAETTLKCFL